MKTMAAHKHTAFSTSDDRKSLALYQTGRPAPWMHRYSLPQPLSATVNQRGYMHWRWKSDFMLLSKLHAPPSTLCLDFAGLADGSDEEICKFAAEWGPLGPDARKTEERVQMWRRYAKLARALLRFTAERLNDGKGRDEDWKTICKWMPFRPLPRMSKTSESEMVVSAVNDWFDRARGHGILDMLDNQPQIAPHAAFLFGILITQIAHLIARSDQVVVCSGCKRPFIPGRPLSRGSRQPCKSCRKKKIPQRDASHDWRRRSVSV